MKRCPRCAESKETSAFGRNKAKSDGLQSMCRACFSAYRREHREAYSARDKAYREANREAIAAYQAAYRAANKERTAQRDQAYRAANREKIAAAREAWVARNGPKVRGYKRAWAERNPDYQASHYQANRQEVRNKQRSYAALNAEAATERVRLWAQENPERHAELMRQGRERRRARQSAAFVENIDRNEVLVRDGGLCCLCGEGVDTSGWHLDHVVPLSRGGEHSYANVAVTHPSCNQRKGSSVSYPNQKG